MTIRFQRFSFVTLVVMVWSVTGSCLRADFTEGMIARWTFNQSGEEVLRDDVNGARLVGQVTPASRNTAVVENGDGTVTLQPKQFFVATDINSEKYPRLQQGVTVWMRLRMDAVDNDHTSFIGGLINGKWPLDWKDVTLIFSQRSGAVESGMRFAAKLETGESFVQGAGLFEPKIGDFMTVVLTFDGNKQLIAIQIDGQTRKIEKKGATRLAPITGFALGHLNPSGGVTLTVDEVRIYEGVVPSDWLAEITPVKSDSAATK